MKLTRDHGNIRVAATTNTSVLNALSKAKRYLEETIAAIDQFHNNMGGLINLPFIHKEQIMTNSNFLKHDLMRKLKELEHYERETVSLIQNP